MGAKEYDTALREGSGKFYRGKTKILPPLSPQAKTHDRSLDTNLSEKLEVSACFSRQFHNVFPQL